MPKNVKPACIYIAKMQILLTRIPIINLFYKASSVRIVITAEIYGERILTFERIKCSQILYRDDNVSKQVISSTFSSIFEDIAISPVIFEKSIS